MRFTLIAFYTALILISLTFGTAVASDKFLRVSLDLMESTKFTDVDCLSGAPGPLALYGCGTGSDGAPTRSVGSFGAVPVVEFGYSLIKGAKRLELLVDYRPWFKFKGRPNFASVAVDKQTVSARLSSISVMLGIFSDITDGVPNFMGSVTPFFGFGIGIAHNRIRNTIMDFPATFTTVPGGSHTDLAWMVTAGISSALDERTSLEFAWRYTDLGEIRTGQSIGSVTWRDGRRNPLPLNLAPTRARMAGHGIRMSLRYSF